MRWLVGRQFLADTDAPDQSWLNKYINPEDQPLVLTAIEHAIKNKSTFELEHRVVRADGSIGWTFSRTVPIMREDGEIDEWLGMASDITERKKAEEALRESEELFHMLADNMSQLAWTCDRLGNVTWYNQRWLDYTGLSYKDMSGWDWSKVQHPDHVHRVVAGVKRSAETGEPWEDSFPLLSKSGEYLEELFGFP